MSLVRALGESLHERLLKLLDGKSFSVVDLTRSSRSTPKVAAVLQHDFSKMEPDTHDYDVIRLQISHALHAVFKQWLADMVLLQCHAAFSQRHANWIREVEGGGWVSQGSAPKPQPYSPVVPGATFLPGRQASGP